LKLKYKFRLILDETWSYGVLGRTGGGVTEAQNVDASEVDMIIGSLSGPLCAAGGFCAGNEEVVEHQRISSASYTYSAALPALLSTTASETINLLQEQPDVLTALRDNVKAMRAQLDPRSDWINVSSSVDNPILLLVLKPEVIDAKKLSIDDQNHIFREVVDEVCTLMVLTLAFCPAVQLTGLFPVPCQQCPYHPTQGLSARSRSQPKRCRLAAHACAQGLLYHRPYQERDGKSGHDHQTCHYEDCKQAKVGTYVHLARNWGNKGRMHWTAFDTNTRHTKLQVWCVYSSYNYT